ncbi:Ku protein [Actinocrinis puniceicyclus]|uniref:Non-homologous end joining protein Ku n=1 Tax=Actinocrinis puniceicyclus TaxID=977794 RepID=A0A8J7WMQ4_9ACTN|nr:Ku protein [Actinocrinis puniceicyclus]MBS2964158.1 Ku protein [Actinocrinis puniceicyclus]
MRSSWKGAISFGLVTVPVSIAPAVEEHNVSLHQVHAPDGGRVRMKRWCELEDREVPYREIARGFDADDEHTVVLTDEDLSALPVPTKKTIDVLAFVDERQIDPVYFAKPYYVAPEKAGAKPYALLRDAMRESGQVAVTKITLSTRESPAVLRVHDDVLVLQLMVWPDEVRTAEGIAPQEAGVRPQELAMAQSLIQTLSTDFPELAGQLRDDYQVALHDLVEAKLEGAPVPHEAPRAAAGDNVIDLMAVLERSVKAARGGRPAGADESAEPAARAAAGGEGEGSQGESGGAAPGAAKKAPANKGAAKKTAARTAPAKKSAAKKTSTTQTGAAGTNAVQKAPAKKAAAKGAARRRVS